MVTLVRSCSFSLFTLLVAGAMSTAVLAQSATRDETSIRRLGGSTRLTTPLRDTTQLAKAYGTTRTKSDVRTVLEQAGLGALTGQVGTSPTLGPVTGQVAAVVRYRRPLVAGAVGVLGLLAAVGLLVALLRHPTPPVAAAGEGDAQLELARGPSGDDRGTGAPEPQRSGNPGEAASPGSASPKPPAAAAYRPRRRTKDCCCR
jgi:hypothetical protein